MSGTYELSSPLPLLAVAHACKYLHSKLRCLNIGETVCVCVHCLLETQSLISPPC